VYFNKNVFLVNCLNFI